MKNKIFELMDKITAKKIEIKDLVEAGKLDDAEKAKAELQGLNTAMDALRELETGEPNKNTEGMKQLKPQKKDVIHEFAEAARRGFAVNYASEGVVADGGYTVPEDIQTKINELKESKFSLESLVSVTNVTTMSGRRVYKTRAQHTGFASVEEGAKITAKDGPKFSAVDYKITKYGGYLPVTEELLEDSDANITAVLTEWLAEEDVATKNRVILETIGEKAEVELKNLDGIKKAINVTLGAAFASSASIVTNDDGLNYLDTLTDGNGRYLLQPSMNPASPLEMTLAVGARRIPLVVVPNDVLATSGKAIPFKIGDLKEAVKLFDRRRLTITTSKDASVTGINAFEQDMTLFKGTERFDCKLIDEKAIVNGKITLTE